MIRKPTEAAKVEAAKAEAAKLEAAKTEDDKSAPAKTTEPSKDVTEEETKPVSFVF